MRRLYAVLAGGVLAVLASASPSTASTPQGDGWDPTLSPDGHYLFFETNVFDHTGQTRMKRTLATGTDVAAPLPMLPMNTIFGSLAVTPSERYIAFVMLGLNGQGNQLDVFVLDTTANTVSLGSLGNAGQAGVGDSDEPSMSDDGRYLVFRSHATNLVSGDSNGGQNDVFVRDRCVSDGSAVPSCMTSTELVSLGPAGVQADDGCDLRLHGAAQSISTDGRYVVFSCTVTPAAAGAFAPGHTCNDPLACTGIFVRDRCVSNGVPVVPCTPSTELVSQGAGGAFPNHDSSVPVISGDGTRVAYSSLATDIIAETLGSFTADVFLYDRTSQTTRRLTTPPAPPTEILSADNLSLSSDGLRVVYKMTPPNAASLSSMYLWADCAILNPTCGDGVLEPGCEECDDSNLIDGDGCDSNCTVTRCGNHVTTTGEQCDDGNLIDGDGCDSNCTFTGCGNDILTDGEDCDDGNTASGDGCSASCTIEPGELTPGGTSKTDCMHEWFPYRQPPKKHGIPQAVLECHDDDPACDFSGQPGDKLCVFRLGLCLNVTDPRLACTPTDIAGVNVSSPKADNPNNDIADFNRTSINFSLEELGGRYQGHCLAPATNLGDTCLENVDCDDVGGDGVCTKPLFEFPPLTDTNQCSDYNDIVVPLKMTRSGFKAGKLTIKLKALSSNNPLTGKPNQTDSDTLKLVCDP